MTILVISIIIVVAIGIAWLMKHAYDTHPEKPNVFKKAKVIHRNFTPELDATGIGPSFSGGHIGVAMVYTHEDEKWGLIVKVEDGDIRTIEVDKEVWAAYEIGSELTIEYKVNRFSGELSFNRILK